MGLQNIQKTGGYKNSKKLIVFFQYRKIDHWIKIYRIFNFTRIKFIKK